MKTRHAWTGTAEFYLAIRWIAGDDTGDIAKSMGVKKAAILAKAQSLRLPPRRTCWNEKNERSNSAEPMPFLENLRRLDECHH